jgi:hypothetical protein
MLRYIGAELVIVEAIEAVGAIAGRVEVAPLVGGIKGAEAIAQATIKPSVNNTTVNRIGTFIRLSFEWLTGGARNACVPE